MLSKRVFRILIVLLVVTSCRQIDKKKSCEHDSYYRIRFLDANRQLIKNYNLAFTNNPLDYEMHELFGRNSKYLIDSTGEIIIDKREKIFLNKDSIGFVYYKKREVGHKLGSINDSSMCKYSIISGFLKLKNSCDTSILVDCGLRVQKW